MIRWLLTALLTSKLMCYSVAHYVATCILHACLSVCLCLSWQQAFFTKTYRIYKQEFSGVSKETSPIMHSSHFNWQHTGQIRKKPSPVRQKIVEKKKKNRCCKVLFVNALMQKFAQIFENICNLITFIQPEHFLN